MLQHPSDRPPQSEHRNLFPAGFPQGLTQLRDLHQLLSEIRSTGAVNRISDSTWFVARYRETVQALTDTRLSSDPSKGRCPADPDLQQHISRAAFPQSLFTTDPPKHTRLRKSVARYLTHRQAELMRPFIDHTTRSLISTVTKRGVVDAVAEIAEPISALTIGKLLGVPKADLDKIVRWSHDLWTEQLDDNARCVSANGHKALREYTAWLLQNPEQATTDGLIGKLLAADTNRLHATEILTMVMLLLVAGLDTSISLISSTLLHLLCHADRRRLLYQSPGTIPKAIEEILRYEGPALAPVHRVATEELTLGDNTIKEGDQVFLCLASANRDERRFTQPDTVLIDRHPNHHLGFGHGIHRCPGAPLATLLTQTVVTALLHAPINIELAVHPRELQWRQGKVRCLRSLPVRFKSATHSG